MRHFLKTQSGHFTFWCAHWTIQAILLVTCFVGMLLISQQSFADDTLTVYSSRKTNLIKPLLDEFEKKHNVEVQLLTGKPKALIARLEKEGKRTPADVLITVDAGNLYAAKVAGLLQPVDDKEVQQIVPAYLRDSENYWYGLSKRMRVIAYAKDRMQPAAVATYQNLTNAGFKGKVCMRSSGNIYNQSLLASIIAHSGKTQAKTWAEGVKNNFARPPKGNDRAQIIDIANGQCDVTLVNTYYVGIMKSNNKNKKQQNAVEKIALSFPNANTTGTHVNVSGIGMVKASKKHALVTKLMNFLVSKKAQTWYAEKNFEYPVRSDVPPSKLVQSFTPKNYKQDTLPMAQLGKYNRKAVMMFDQVGWQ